MSTSLPRTEPTPRFGSLTDAADLLGLSERTLRRKIAAGDLTGYRVGPRIIRVNLDEVLALMSPIPTTEAF